MIHVSVGTEIYGRVKQVGSTPVVTKFWALSLMPIVPLQSYYFIRFGQRKSQGCPFLAESYSTAIVGIPLGALGSAIRSHLICSRDLRRHRDHGFLLFAEPLHGVGNWSTAQ